ncbi:MAG: gamma-glutamyl-gamma-aminobutyrate hydrolase family protein [Solirubrobacteraceae bacterium]
MARPAIGICTPLERVRFSVWDVDAFVLARNYVDAVHRSGAMALLLAPDPAITAQPDELLERLDGLMLAGGADIDPSTYGAAAHPETVDIVPERDAFEIALAQRALERDLPLLGICRGMQIINVARGGTLHQHLPELLGHQQHRRVVGTFDGADHVVRLQQGSLAARAAGEQLHAVKSHHHQGVDRVGDGLRVTGWAEMDDFPYALEDPGNHFALGIPWHTEADARARLVTAFVQETAAVSGSQR